MRDAFSVSADAAIRAAPGRVSAMGKWPNRLRVLPQIDAQSGNNADASIPTARAQHIERRIGLGARRTFYSRTRATRPVLMLRRQVGSRLRVSPGEIGVRPYEASQRSLLRVNKGAGPRSESLKRAIMGKLGRDRHIAL